MSAISRQFSGIWVPVATPFNAEQTVDHEALKKLVQMLAASGIAGLVVCGTTGEPATLSEQEKVDVLQTVLSHCDDLPVVMGITGIAPTEVCRQIEHWQQWPIAGFLLPPPYYIRPAQPGIVEFYRVAASTSRLPIIAYDIPYRTGVELTLDTLLTLAGIDNIVAIKDCGGDARKTQALIADGRLQVLAGEDHLIFTTICQGGSGAIAASAHLHPRLFVAMHRAIGNGQLDDARRLHHLLAPMIDALFVEPNPALVKAVLASLGYLQKDLRAPLSAASEQAAQRAIAAYKVVMKLLVIKSASSIA
jgi:4-hydroxy-tetrahydrodipicolinate synthase